ncbi:hypothetical protein AZE99_07485 [Sphingorhabdus sp. M41]|nr:hypothetical protein AZE99_07485 [Sphingorhabdus sp. M41]
MKLINEKTSVNQDLRIAGGDVIEFVDLIAEKYGDEVYQWPWDRFAILDEGLSPLFLPMLVWQLISWPFRGTFGYPNELERLTMGHIAKAIDTGHWIEPHK